MVILAVGLLGLAAMQVIGARSVARAGQGTDHTLLAVRAAEGAAAAIRRGELPTDAAWLEDGDSVRLEVLPGPPPRVRAVVLPVAGGRSGLGRSDSVSVSLIP